MKRLVVVAVFLLFAGCAEIEQSAGMVLDNANDAVRTGEPKVWMQPTRPVVTPTPMAIRPVEPVIAAPSSY